MTIERAIEILKGTEVPNTREEIEQAERMATYSLELWNEFKSLVDYSFDADNREYEPSVLIAINDFKRMIDTSKRQIEKQN